MVAKMNTLGLAFAYCCCLVAIATVHALQTAPVGQTFLEVNHTSASGTEFSRTSSPHALIWQEDIFKAPDFRRCNMPTIADTGRRLVVAFWCGPEEGSTHGSLWVTTREHAAATMRERAAVPTPQQPQGPVAHPQQGALRPGPQPQGSTARASSTGNAANGANVATPARPNTTDVPPKGVAQPSSSANPSSLPWSANSWSTPVEVAVGLVREASVGGLRRLPIGNPVLCFLPDAKPGAKKGGGKRGGSRLVLFYRVWWKAAWGMVMVSNDEGRTWGEPSRLPANVTGPAKSKPLMLDSGRLLYGASSGTRRGNKVAIEWTGDQGVTWHSSGWINGRGTVLPASFPALFWGGGPPEERAAGSPGPRGPLRMIAEAPRRVGRLVQAVSADLGTTWGPLFVSKLPSAESRISLATFRASHF
eukprot:jgi/Mesvir1/18382/Mv14264-RA.2